MIPEVLGARMGLCVVRGRARTSRTSHMCVFARIGSYVRCLASFSYLDKPSLQAQLTSAKVPFPPNSVPGVQEDGLQAHYPKASCPPVSTSKALSLHTPLSVLSLGLPGQGNIGHSGSLCITWLPSTWAFLLQGCYPPSQVPVTLMEMASH